jgi:NADH-quinone oxidoreductase subunit L
MYFLVFHGPERFGKPAHHDPHAAHAKPAQPALHMLTIRHTAMMTMHADDTHAEHHGLAPGQKPHETPWVVTLPLIMLAIPSVIIGYIGVEPMLFGDYFKSAIFVDAEAHPVMEELAHHFHGAFAMATHAVTTPVSGSRFSVLRCLVPVHEAPGHSGGDQGPFRFLYTLLDNKYYFDKFNEVVFAGGARLLGRGLWKGGDAGLIDGIIVNGATRLVRLVCDPGTLVPDRSHLPLRFYDDYRRVRLDDPVGHARLS